MDCTARGSSESAPTMSKTREAGFSPMSPEKKPVAGSTSPSFLVGAPSLEDTPTRILGRALVPPGTPHRTESVPRTDGWYSTTSPSFFRAGPALWYQVFVSPSTAHSGPCPGAED